MGLLNTCQRKDINSVGRAIERGSSINRQDSKRNTPLHLCSNTIATEIVKLLLKNRADVNIQNNRGETPLHLCSITTATEIVSLLLKHGADVNIQNNRGNTPLHLCSINTDTEIVKLLLKHKADVSIQNRNGSTPLHLCAWKGNVKISKLLLSNNAYVNIQDKFGLTALHYSTGTGNITITKLLLEHGADINVKGFHSFTPLIFAIINGNETVVEYLLQNGGVLDVDDYTFHKLIDDAKYKGCKKICSILERTRSSFSLKPVSVTSNADGEQALTVQRQPDKPTIDLLEACLKNDIVSATRALENGASVNVQVSAGYTPLHFCAEDGNTEVAKLLLAHKADIHMKKKDGRTPLHLSVRSGETEMAKLLLVCKADINIKDIYGYTPLHVSVANGNMEMTKLLLTHKADVNVKSRFDVTPLAMGIIRGYEKIVECLLEHGAILDTDRFSQYSLMAIARYTLNKKICSLLESTTTRVKFTLRPEKVVRESSTTTSNSETASAIEKINQGASVLATQHLADQNLMTLPQAFTAVSTTQENGGPIMVLNINPVFNISIVNKVRGTNVAVGGPLTVTDRCRSSSTNDNEFNDDALMDTE